MRAIFAIALLSRVVKCCLTTALLTATLSAAEPRVAYSLRAYAPGTSEPIEAVKAGGEFDLAMVVQDLREPVERMHRGVFAAYVNVNYDKRKAELRHVQFNAPYSTQKALIAERQGGIGPWGASRGLGSGGTSEVEVSRIRFLAHFPPGIVGNETKVSFRPQFLSPPLLDLNQPRFNTLLYGTTRKADVPGGREFYPGEQSYVTLGEIRAEGVSVRVLR